MSSAPTSAIWGHLFVVLFVQSTVVISMAGLIGVLLKHPAHRQALCRATFLMLGLIACLEIVGVRAALRTWLVAQPLEKPEWSFSLVVDPVPDEPLSHSLVAAATERRITIPPDNNLTVPEETSWRPGIVWLAGTAAIGSCIAASRVLLAVFCRRNRIRPSNGIKTLIAKLARLCGLKKRVRVVQSKGLRTPIAFGVIRPAVGLPADFDDTHSRDRQEVVLIHEVAHLKHRDPAWQLMANLAAAAFWCQPLVWWARRRLQSASEDAADLASLRLPDGASRLAECLVQAGRSISNYPMLSASGVSGSGFKSQLGRRVEKLLELNGNSSMSLYEHKRYLVLVAIVLLMVTSAIGAIWVPAYGGDPLRQGGPFGSVWHRSGLQGVDDSKSLLGRREHESAKQSGRMSSANNPNYREVSSGSSAVGVTLGLDPDRASRGRLQNSQRLNTIIVPEFGCRDESLAHVITKLYNLAEDLNPTGDGVNFLIDSSADPSFEPTPIDFDSGQPIPIVSGLPQYAHTAITIEPPLKNVLLGTVVQTVARASSIPLTIRIEDHAVVFSRDTKLELSRNRKARVDAESFELIPGSLLSSKDSANQELLAKLDQIILEEVHFKNWPLGDVIKVFIDESKKRNPYQGGIGFIINNQLVSPSADFAIGDLAESKIVIDPPLKNVSLSEALETVALGSEVPLLITLNDNTVLLSQRVTSPPEVAVESSVLATDDSHEISEPGHMVRIEIQMVEFQDHALQDLGLDWFLKGADTAGVTLTDSDSMTGDLKQIVEKEFAPKDLNNLTTQYQSLPLAPYEMLTPDQMRRLMSRVRNQAGVELLTSPTITTPDGRPAVVSSLSPQTVVVDVDPAGVARSATLNFGSTIDVIPSVDDETGSIRLEIAALVREFLGYGGATSANGTDDASVKLLLRALVRQVTAEASLSIGNTLVVAGPDRVDRVVTKDKVPILGDIPMIGRLFQNNKNSTHVKKWVVFVTADLVERPEGDELGRGVESPEAAADSTGASPPGRP